MKLPKGAWKHGDGLPKLMFADAAKEFGVSQAQLRGLLAYHHGPKPTTVFLQTGSAGKRSYYQAAELRKWWESIKESLK
jgi:hypothetical protein